MTVGARRRRSAEGSAELVREELRKLGPMSTGQRNVLIAFGDHRAAVDRCRASSPSSALSGSAFATRLQTAVPEGVAAMLGAMLLFVLPIDWRARRFTLTWDEAVRIDWGIVLLYGGGLAMGDLAFSTGWPRRWATSLTSWLPSHSPLALTHRCSRRWRSCCRRRRRTPRRPT